ncbi:MAG: acetyl-CoA carboxylase carboxyltransferase subunit alpha [Kiritimatiellia bacterium]
MELDFEKKITEVERKINDLTKVSSDRDVRFDTEIAELRSELETLKKEAYSTLTPWQTVQVARHPRRPHFLDYVSGIPEEFIELHGDRCYGDDRALRGGFADIDGRRIMLLGMEKGFSMEEKVESNFGMPHPEGYRKALRLMKLAEKYGLPVVCLIDTPAAYPGMEAEERGQAESIARNLTEMAGLETPVIVVITGEGGSGGALGIAVGDVVMMLSYSIYSVIPPEGCAAILWRDATKAPQAAEALKLTSDTLLEQGIIDEIIEEPPGGAHRDREAVFQAVKKAVVKHIDRLARTPVRRLLDRRFTKYAKIGKFDGRKHAKH